MASPAALAAAACGPRGTGVVAFASDHQFVYTLGAPPRMLVNGAILDGQNNPYLFGGKLFRTAHSPRGQARLERSLNVGRSA